MESSNRRTRVGAAAVVTAVALLIGWAAAAAFSGRAAARPVGVTGALAFAPRAGAGRAPSAGAVRAAALTPARLAAGAGPLPPGWVAAAHTIDVGGLERVYLTVEPAVLTQPVPVVVLMHGRGMTPGGILHVSDLARRVGPAVLILPAGWHRSWNAGDCCGTAWLHRVDDVAFISDAVADVLAVTPQAQAARVYAVGFSNGGRMAFDLACRLPGLFAGFMAVEAVPVEACRAARPVDMTIVAQQRDPLLTVEAGQAPKTIGGFVEPTVGQILRRMTALDGCAGAPSVAAAGLSVERTWSCPHGTVRYVWYPGGRHSWRPASGSTPGATAFVLQLLKRGSPAQVPAGPSAGDRAASVTAEFLPSHRGAEGRASVGR